MVIFAALFAPVRRESVHAARNENKLKINYILADLDIFFVVAKPVNAPDAVTRVANEYLW